VLCHAPCSSRAGLAYSINFARACIGVDVHYGQVIHVRVCGGGVAGRLRLRDFGGMVGRLE